MPIFVYVYVNDCVLSVPDRNLKKRAIRHNLHNKHTKVVLPTASEIGRESQRSSSLSETARSVAGKQWDKREIQKVWCVGLKGN